MIREKYYPMEYTHLHAVNHSSFINEMKVVDDIIIDLCLYVHKFEKQYEKNFVV